jgi:hypothetical protein
MSLLTKIISLPAVVIVSLIGTVELWNEYRRHYSIYSYIAWPVLFVLVSITAVYKTFQYEAGN